MKKNKKVTFWILYHAGMVIFSLLAAMLMKYRQTGDAFVPGTILVSSTILVLSLSCGYLAIFMTNKAKNLSHEKLTKRIVPGFLLFVVATFVMANLVVSAGVFIWYIIHDKDLSRFIPNLFKYELSYANGNLIIWFMFFAIAFFYVLWKKSAKKEQNLREEKLKHRYQTLKAQVNPHFLFNSFNSLSELVYENPKKADNYIQQLSGIYRYILENEETKLIPIQEEIKFVKEYFELQQVRDKDKIEMEIVIDETDDFLVIPVSVQLLVENALKHNSKSKANPLVVQIKKEGDHLVVSNNIQRKNTFENSTKLGLNNLKERTKLILDKDVIIKGNDGNFVVKLPVST